VVAEPRGRGGQRTGHPALHRIGKPNAPTSAQIIRRLKNKKFNNPNSEKDYFLK
jgi:hypothetical protein